ncbi:hypothetical protein Nepgr_027100 [Nepenthes gracilis]|uniref:Uncharacterized protein n=1 Tax=Nepenthes gracilis TaxID=150966 RepID=A0AAD3Y0Z0_NEPGR|nr:hypothetical protein Nepgr_027100 [Nepenthes gracilis]
MANVHRFYRRQQACLKDSFPLPRIDLLVDSTAGHELLSFMDVYSGYNQIRMSPEDEEYTSFMTDQGTYCYRVMPFGLKNAGATYQRLVNRMFEKQIGRNMEVYVDDMLVKSRVTGDHIRDLEESFGVLCQHQMKLNPAKCVFGVSSGKFLGFIVSQRGIEVNPEKIKALADMAPPRSVKDVQRLTGRLAALSRFLAKSGDKYQPFFKALRGTKSNGFQWTADCQTAFDELKQYLASPPLLTSPKDEEELYLYLAVSEASLSSVLVRQESDIQQPVYYVSKTLTGPETRYPRAKKVALALIFAARKLRPFFQAHRVVVLTDQPLKGILQKPDVSGRLPGGAPEWTLHVDGSSTDNGNGAGVILTTPDGFEIKYSLKLDFSATNNVAEYEALLAGLRLTKECSAKRLVVHSDSELIVNQVNGGFEANNPSLARYLAKAKEAIQGFDKLTLVHVPRAENWKADRLARAAAAENPE